MFNLFKSKPVEEPQEEIIELTEDMRIKPEPVKPFLMIETSWDHKHCAAIGCNKAFEGCCLAYKNPAILPWFRQGKECPTGPFISSKAKEKTKLNPIKASKRKTK